MEIVQLPLFDGKVCRRCGTWKPLTEYYLQAGKHQARCKECKLAYEHARHLGERLDPAPEPHPYGNDQNKCRVCGLVKPLSEFYIRSETGHPRTECKECYADIGKWRYKRSYNEIRASQREKYEQVKDDPEFRQNQRDARLRRRGKALQTKAAYRATRREELREKARARYYQNPGPFKVRASFRRRLIKYRTEGAFSWGDWKAMCAWFGGICLKCGKAKRLTIDHVLPLALGGSHTIDNLQPLCRSCNCSKRANHIDYGDPECLAAFLATL